MRMMIGPRRRDVRGHINAVLEGMNIPSDVNSDDGGLVHGQALSVLQSGEKLALNSGSSDKKGRSNLKAWFGKFFFWRS